jgi:23S rRNA (guanosine2251-2'-O)-methyltransferase
VREALRARRRRLERLWLRADRSRADDAELIDLAERAGVRIEAVASERLQDLGEPGSNPQGVALRVGPLPELSLAELVEGLSPEPGRSVLLALDGVEDPQNLGAVARVAEAAGVAGLVLTRRHAPPLTPAVSRASAGAIEWLPVARVPNLRRALGELKERGFWVVAAAAASGRELGVLEDRLLLGELVVVLGAEGRGIRPGVLEQADHRVAIPMRGHVESLNVSTAGAIILYDLLRRADRARGEAPSEEV